MSISPADFVVGHLLTQEPFSIKHAYISSLQGHVQACKNMGTRKQRTCLIFVPKGNSLIPTEQEGHIKQVDEADSV